MYNFGLYDKNISGGVIVKKNLLSDKKYGKGSVVLSTLSALNGCIGYNPTLDKFLINLIEK